MIENTQIEYVHIVLQFNSLHCHCYARKYAFPSAREADEVGKNCTGKHGKNQSNGMR